MKTFISILTITVIIGAFTIGFFYGKFKPAVQTPQQLTLEQILSIKELHLVKHTYNDLFFLHKHNNPEKAIRAIVQVPVVVTAYIDLKEIQLIKHNDSVRQVVLPRAQMNEPIYQVHNMVIRETRSFQLHAGRDLYPQVGAYLQQAIATRIDTVRHLAVTNRILVQAEEEAKEYVIMLLHELGHHNIEVIMIDEEEKIDIQPVKQVARINRLAAKVDATPFGFIPWK